MESKFVDVLLDQAKAIFIAARNYNSGSTREKFLSHACGSNASLRVQVENLLAAGEQGANGITESDADADAEVETIIFPADEPPVEQPVQPLIERIGRYRIERVLGEGGFGLVYLAYDEQLNRRVAIKVPHHQLVDRVDAAKEYLAEARAVAMLDHSHIVPVYDVGTSDDYPCFIVSKYVEGTNLAKRMKQSRLTLDESVELVATVAEALHYLHKQGVVHRDIKPGNILLDQSGKPFVADFGLALREQDSSDSKGFAGTPAYMSPEQARGEGHRVDGRSDLFSLGIVFYELLVGKRPFRGESLRDLREQITNFEPRPPRQYDEQIPKELDRVCLKSLSKRASERYSTAVDMAKDLRDFQAEAMSRIQFRPGNSETNSPPNGSRSQPVLSVGASGSISIGEVGTATHRSTQSERLLVNVVPKGLRSFDAHDASFFLDLLPGPRDREGLPDSIRFWKTRIEEADADKTFSVGLIYGPSGCGKSSLVKAGLVPHLSPDVIAVYLESTAEETELRILNGLRKRCPELPENLGLVETLAALRRGKWLPAGKKIVIVLDQFEQWLYAHREETNSDLSQALRQCSGDRLQCILMVRDDFWLAVTRFLFELEINLVQGGNTALVDLFDLDHARKVLGAFGRAFGKLPETSSEITRDQKEFIKQVVSGLSQENKVICVRLALFAEMMKGRSWTPASLKQVGGTEGVGATFLEETFSSSTANPRHRFHQKPARAVLKALLPDSGTNIKGSMRSYAELMVASGYGNRPKDFDDLIGTLDSDLRLITPTDPEGTEEEVEGGGWRVAGTDGDASTSFPTTLHPSPSTRFYQLTHDYLVPSLRDWLTRKQRETRRGRAELQLADCAAVWNARPENRQLPSLLQWFNFRWCTQKKNWSLPQKKMMAQAGQYHGLQGLVLLTVSTLIGWGGFETYGVLKAHALRDRVLDANTTEVPTIVKEMGSYRRWINPLLRFAYARAEEDNDARQRLHASLALLPVDTNQVAYLTDRLLDAEPKEVPVIRDALASHKDELGKRLWNVVEKPEKGKESQRLRAAAVLATYDPDSKNWGNASGPVVDQLVAENPVFLGLWLETFRPVKNKLMDSLVSVYKKNDGQESERNLATNILADYAAEQPSVLADLLMDADDKQFAVIFPKFKEHGDRSISEVVAEITARKVVAELKDKLVFETKGAFAEGDAKVKTARGPLVAKRFEVRLLAGKTYRLTMESVDLDSYMELIDEAGKSFALDDDSGGYWNPCLMYTADHDDSYVVLAAAVPNLEDKKKETGDFVLKIIETLAVDEANKDKLAKRQANGAVALLRMNQPERVWPLLMHSPDPRVRSYLIHRLSPLGADPTAIANRIADEKIDITIRRALLLSLGEYNETAITPADRTALLPMLQEIYFTATDPGLRAATEWLLRQWKQEAWLAQVNDDWAKDMDGRTKKIAGIRELLTNHTEQTPPQWYVNGQGQTFVVIPGPVEFTMGSPTSEKDRSDDEVQHKQKIARTFALSAKSVTQEQFRQFDEGNRRGEIQFHRMADLPAVVINWYAAAKYCNWLSQKEGIPEDQWCYEINGDETKLKENSLRLTGYRLPTEPELEFGTRAGAFTSRYFGESDELLLKYAWYSKNSTGMTWPVGSLKPNDLGLFDVHGNVWTWCQEIYERYPLRNRDETNNEAGGPSVVSLEHGRTLRGGGFLASPSKMRSAHRSSHLPTTSEFSYGFRLARTFPMTLD